MRKVVSKIRSGLEYILDLWTMTIFLLLFIVGLYAVFDVQQISASAEVDEKIVELAPDTEDAEDKVDFAELKSINPEILAWIRIDDTKIDYPIVQARDNTKYLTRNYRGEYATAGSVFLDYRNHKFEDDLSIIYAHRMSNQLMFGGIALFKDADYFQKHPTGTLYTETATYNLEIMHFAVLNIDNASVYTHEREWNGNNAKIINDIKNSARQSREVEIAANDKLILLSTCDKDAKHYRNVLLAKMIPR